MAGTQKLCHDAQLLAENGPLTAALFFQAILNAAILTLSSTVVFRRAWRQKAVHVNLKILLANVILLNFFTCTPALVNRVRLLWLVSVGYVAVLVVLTVSDPEFRPRNYYVSFSAGYATQLVFYGHFVLLGLELLSAAVDVALMLVNRRKLKDVAQGYSLSRSYQLSENITVTLYLALPLNICNSILYTVFVALSVWVRGLRGSIAHEAFHSTLEWINLLSKLQMLLSLLILLRFGKRESAKATVVEHNDNGDVHFQLFRQQIASASNRPLPTTH